jgi:molecular chaperone GrpE
LKFAGTTPDAVFSTSTKRKLAMPPHHSEPIGPAPVGPVPSGSSQDTEPPAPQAAAADAAPARTEVPPVANESPAPACADPGCADPGCADPGLEQPAPPARPSDVDIAVALVEAEARAAEHRDAWLRTKAEAENIRRRAQEDVAKASKFAAEKFAGAMLPVKDSLEAALATENQTLEKLREGVELTLKQLVGAFEGAALAEENPLGTKFDPNRHQAIGTLEADAEPNTVVKVLQKGYLLHGRVIRPAMVMVARPKA